MTDDKALTPADPCPQCGGAFRADASQAPERLIDRNKRNAANPAAAARYAEQVTEKAKEFGTLYRCGACGYQARMQPAGGPAADPAADGAAPAASTRSRAHRRQTSATATV